MTAVDHGWLRTLSGQLTPDAFMETIANHGKPVVLEYGLYANAGGLAPLRTLQQLGPDPWWFDGIRPAAFTAWRAREHP